MKQALFFREGNGGEKGRGGGGHHFWKQNLKQDLVGHTLGGSSPPVLARFNTGVILFGGGGGGGGGRGLLRSIDLHA